MTKSNKNEPTTARFNVGGQHFEVARSVIEKFPESMLAKLASKTWQNDPDSVVFIDADGERFRCCLDYIRYGKAHLPMTVVKAAVLRDLDYYGIDGVNPNDLDDLSAATRMAELEGQKKEELRELRSAVHKRQQKILYAEIVAKFEELFVECLEKYNSLYLGKC